MKKEYCDYCGGDGEFVLSGGSILKCNVCDGSGEVPIIYYELKRDWDHPYRPFPAGTTYTARIWADLLGNTTEKEFLAFMKAGRFKKWFKEK